MLVEQREKPQYYVDVVSALAERTITRLWIIVIILAVLLFGSNAAWMAYLSNYDFESYAISSEGGGNANYIGNDGDIYNGESLRCEAD